MQLDAVVMAGQAVNVGNVPFAWGKVGLLQRIEDKETIGAEAVAAMFMRLCSVRHRDSLREKAGLPAPAVQA